MATTISSGTNPYKLGSPPDFGTLYSGRALTFDGVTDYVDTGATFQSTFRDSFTISMWVKPDDGHPSVYENIFGAINSPTQDGVYLTIAADGKLDFVYESNDLKAFAKSNSAEFSDGATAWTHMVCVVDNTAEASSIYKNGVLVTLDGTHDGGFDTNSVVMSNFTTGHNLFIGARNNYDTDANHFSGKISNVQLWDKAWSLSDVQYAYTHPEKLVTDRQGGGVFGLASFNISNLKAWYPCTEGNPRSPQTTVYDGSPKELGSEEAVNGAFDDASGWELQADGWTIANGVASGNGTVAKVIYDDVFTQNALYKVVYTVKNYSSGNVNISMSNATETGTQRTANGTYTEYGYCTVNNNIYFKSNSFVGDIDDISIKEVQMGNHGTTTFVGLEQISATNDRTFAGASNWQDDATSANQWAEDSGTYNESATSGADEDELFTDNYLELIATSDGSDKRNAYLDGAHWEDGDGASGEAMVAGRTYRLSYSIDLTAYTSGTLTVGFATADRATIDTDYVRTYTSTQQAVTHTIDFVYDGTTNHAILIISASTSSAFTVYFDNFSIKEVGVASGWTTADAEPLIPQTALMGMSKPMVMDGIDDYLTKAVSNYRASDSSGTISAWVKCPSSVTTGAIFGTSDTGTDDYYLNLAMYSGELNLWEKNNDTDTQVKSTTSINDDKLHHCVLTADGSAYKLYIDGALETLATSTENDGKWLNVTGDAERDNITIGVLKRGSLTGYWNGYINEVSIWNDDLTLAEVQELFNDGVALDATTHSASSELVGYWRNDGASTWTDLEGSDDLTASGSPETILLPEGTTSGKDILGFPLTHTNNGWLNLDRGFVKVKDEGVMVLDNSPFTVEFWLKRHGVNLTDKSCYPLGKYRNSQNNWSVSLNKYDDLLFWAEVGNVACIQCQIDATGEAQDYHDEDWHHFAFTAERETADPSTKLIWYVDGTAYSGSYEERLNTITSLDIDADLGIGTYAAGSPDSNVPVPQTLDEVRIYKRALSATEVLKNYNHGLSKHSN